MTNILFCITNIFQQSLSFSMHLIKQFSINHIHRAEYAEMFDSYIDSLLYIRGEKPLRLQIMISYYFHFSQLLSVKSNTALLVMIKLHNSLKSMKTMASSQSNRSRQEM